MEPPDPIPNSEVKRVIADGSVGSPHVRVGHRQAPNPKAHPLHQGWAFLLAAMLPSACLPGSTGDGYERRRPRLTAAVSPAHGLGNGGHAFGCHR